MSPCSLALNPRCSCDDPDAVIGDNSVPRKVVLCLDSSVGPIRLCQALSLASCLQEVNADSHFINCPGSCEIDSAKLDVLCQRLSQCGKSGQSCNVVISLVELMSSDKPVNISLKPRVLSKSEQRKKCLQHGMALHFNPPPKIREHQGRQNDDHHEPQNHEHHEPENDEHHEPENHDHHEPENDDHHEPQNDEPENDSGFGSGGWQEHLLVDSRNDLDNLSKNCSELSQCCFYYGSCDSQTSNNLLRNKPTGTFLIRDSSDPRYLYSLSVKTEKGATSIRILYCNGFFQFDSDERIRHQLPRFDSVLALIDFHVRATEEGSNKLWRWEDMTGSKSLRVMLKMPLKNSVPSLSHLSQVKINQCMNNVECPQLSIDRLPLDLDYLKELLRKYPYQI